MTTSSPVVDALTKAEHLLFELPVLESFVARREAGETLPGDEGTADALVEELLTHQSADGSWGGSLQLTAEALLLMADLAPATRKPDCIERALLWLRGRRGQEGGFGEDCTPDLHRAGICQHFAAGYFSPGPANLSFAGTTLANGLRLESDQDARLALSALAQRAVLAHAAPRTDDLLQVDALRRIADLLFRDGGMAAVPAGLVVLVALTRAPRNASHLSIIHGAFSRLVRMQRADGTWPGADMFHVVEALLIAIRAGYGSPAFDAALARTAEKLALAKQHDVPWQRDADSYRLLTGWRVLRYVAANNARP